VGVRAEEEGVVAELAKRGDWEKEKKEKQFPQVDLQWGQRRSWLKDQGVSGKHKQGDQGPKWNRESLEGEGVWRRALMGEEKRRPLKAGEVSWEELPRTDWCKGNWGGDLLGRLWFVNDYGC